MYMHCDGKVTEKNKQESWSCAHLSRNNIGQWYMQNARDS